MSTGSGVVPSWPFGSTSAVVSFDVFDTLLERPFWMPHEVFLYLQDDILIFKILP